MLHSENPPTELGQFTGFLMAYLGSRSGRRFAAALEPFGLHPRHFGVMTVLDKRPGLTQQELADHSNVDRSSMVAVLDELERMGAVERRKDPADRRANALHITPRGRRLLTKARTAVAGAEDAFLAPLAPAEQQRLRAALRTLVESS